MSSPPDRDAAVPNEPGRRRTHFSDLLLRIGRVVSIAVLFFLFYFLVQRMVDHRFFRGSEMGRNGHPQQ